MFIDILFLLFFGILAGITSGMFGVGGGVVFVPTIYFYLSSIGVDYSIIHFISIATSLFAGSLSTLSSSLNHFIIKNIDFKKAFLLAIGSVITAVTTPFFVVDFSPDLLKYILICILFFVALKMLLENNISKNSNLKLNDLFLVLFGMLVGIISSISGLGGGVIFVPLLVYFFSLDIKRAIGTSSLVVFFTMLSSTITFSLLLQGNEFGINQLGYVNYLIGLLLGIGAIIGAIFGVKLVETVNNVLLKKIFAIFLIIVIIKMFF